MKLIKVVMLNKFLLSKNFESQIIFVANLFKTKNLLKFSYK